MRTKPTFNFTRDIDFSNAEGNAQEINVKPTATAPAELLAYAHLKVIPYSSTQYQVVKGKLKTGAVQTPTTQTLINKSDVTVEAKHDKKAAATSNAEGHRHGGRERRLAQEQQGGVQSPYGQQSTYGQPGYQSQIAAEMAYQEQMQGQQYMDPNGASESYGYAEGSSSAIPTWAKFLFIPGVIAGAAFAWHTAKGKTFEGKAKYIHYAKFAVLGAIIFNIPQAGFAVKELLTKKAPIATKPVVPAPAAKS